MTNFNNKTNVNILLLVFSLEKKGRHDNSLGVLTEHFL